jgi:uncharacterized protein (TIGR00369 family)
MAPPPVFELVGFQLASVDEGRAVIEFEPGPRHFNPQGTVHGGILCDVADAAMGIAYGSTLDEDVTFTTVELKINYMRAVRTEPLKVIGRVVKGGQRIGFTDCEIRDAEGRLMATATSTCMILPER